MEFQAELREILLRLQASALTRQDRNRLVFLCIAIARSALTSYHRRTAELLASHGWTLDDLALDCVANLFETNSEGLLPKFQAFLEHLDVPLHETTDGDLFLAFKPFLNKFIYLRLVKILSEVDPEGRRIARNFRAALKRKDCPARLSMDFRGEVVVPIDGDYKANLPEYPLEELQSALSAYLRPNIKTLEIIDRLINVLTDQASYRSSIRLIDLVQLLKRLYSGVFFLDQNSESQIDVGLIEERDLAPLRLSTLKMIADKLEGSYLRKGKVSKSEAKGLLISMSYLLDDWFAGISVDHQYFPYLERGLGCSKKEYDEQWATLMNYFVKLAREHIWEELDEIG